MKRDFLGLQAVNELPESCVGLLVGYAGDEASIVFDLFVEFSTLITHGIFRIRAQNGPSDVSCAFRRGRQPGGTGFLPAGRLGAGSLDSTSHDCSRSKPLQYFAASRLDQPTAAERRRPAIRRGLRFRSGGAEMTGHEHQIARGHGGGQIISPPRPGSTSADAIVSALLSAGRNVGRAVVLATRRLMLL